jgi:hypothetical protein
MVFRILAALLLLTSQSFADDFRRVFREDSRGPIEPTEVENRRGEAVGPREVVPVPPANQRPRYPRALYFHAKWCIPCKVGLEGPDNFVKWLKPQGWQIDDTNRAHVQLVDVDKSPEIMRTHKVTSIPCLVLLRGPGDSGEPVPYTGKESIPALFKGRK